MCAAGAATTAESPNDAMGFLDNGRRGYALLKHDGLDHGKAVVAIARNHTEYLDIRNALKVWWGNGELKKA